MHGRPGDWPTLEEPTNRGLELLRDPVRRGQTWCGIRAVVRGVFSRPESVEKLSKCVRCGHEGQIWANSREMLLALEALALAPTVTAIDANGLNLLSKREKEIVHSLAEGLLTGKSLND